MGKVDCFIGFPKLRSEFEKGVKPGMTEQEEVAVGMDVAKNFHNVLAERLNALKQPQGVKKDVINEVKRETAELTEESQVIIESLKDDIFPQTVKEFIDTLRQFEEYGGPLGQFKAQAALKRMEAEGLVRVEGNRIIPTFEATAEDTYRPQAPATIGHVNSKRKQPIGIVTFGNNFMFQTDLGEVLTKVGDWMKKYFRSRGMLPKDVFDAWNGTKAETQKYEADIRFTVKRLRGMIAAEYPSGQITDGQITDLNLALSGQPTSQPIPPRTMEVIKEMRAQVDNLSRRFVNEKIVAGNLAQKFMSNLGTYLTRSYKKYDDPAWKDDVPAQIFNQAMAFIRAKYPGYSQQELDGLLNYLLYSPDAPMNVIKGGSLAKMDLSVLKKRGKIAPEIRAAMGEYSDPIINYARSITKMADMVSKNHFQQEVKKMGMGVFLFDQPTGKYFTHIKQGPSAAPSPLDGLYTTPEIAEAFNEFNGPQPNPPWIKWLLRQNARVNMGLTVLSPTTHSRNFISNAWFAMMNGHYRFDKIPTALVGWQNVSQKFEKLTPQQQAAGVKTAQEKLREYIGLGLINDVATTGAMREILNEVRDGVDLYNGVNGTQGAISEGTSKAIRAAERFYQWGDNAWKVFAFENEVERYRAAYPAWTDQQVKEQAAKIVRDTYPTYSMIPRGISKVIKGIPFVGGFVSFPSEVVRTTYNTLELAGREMASGNPQLVKAGATRFAGSLFALTSATALSYGTRAMLDMDGEDEEDLRKFVGPWQTSNEFLFLNNEGGKYTIVDLGSFDAHSYLKRPVYALLQGKAMGQAAWDSFKEMVEPFLNEQVFSKRLVDLTRNQDERGRQIYNPDSAAGEQIADANKYFFKGIVPGFVKAAVNISKAVRGVTDNEGREYRLSNELLAIFPGARVQTIDVSESVKYKAADIRKRIDQAERDYNKVFLSKSATPEEKEQALTRLSGTISTVYHDAEETLYSARRLGADVTPMATLDFRKFYGIIK